MGKLIVVSHPEVEILPAKLIPEWRLSEIGRHRAEVFSKSETLSSVTAVWSSTERKALETAAILADVKGLAVHSDVRLCENDRSATGFLPSPQFEAAADAFFASPKASFRGWETANAAQKRIVDAVTSIVAAHLEGDLAIVTHGAVGTLLWCHLSGKQINRRFDQPAQGHFWCADLETLCPDFGWRSIT